MADQGRKAARADLAAADVLMAVELRAVCRLAVVVVDHHQLLEADLLVELLDEPIDLVVAAHLHAGAPEVRRVEAVGHARQVDAASRHGLVDVDQLVEALADPVPATRAVLEHQEGGVIGRRHAVQDALDRLGDPCHPSLDPGPHVRADVHVDERGTVLRGNAKLVAEQLHRLLTEDRIRTGEVRQVGGVHREGAEAVLLHAGAERGELLREFRPSRPSGRIPGEDLESHRPDSSGAIGRLDQPRSGGEMRAEHAVQPPRRCLGGAARQLRTLRCHGERVPRAATRRSLRYASAASASRATAATAIVVHPAARSAAAAASNVAPLVQMSSTRIARGGTVTPARTAKTRSSVRRRSLRPSAWSAGTARVRSRSGTSAREHARDAAAAISAA